MEVNKKKEERQIIGINKWFNANCIGILDWYTGVGKSYGAILAIKRMEKVTKTSYVIIVPSDPLRQQWIQVTNKVLPKNVIERLKVFTVQELLISDIRIECGLCIVDEIHEFTSDDRISVLNKFVVNWKYFLGLTASSDDKMFFRVTMYIPIIDIITEQEALQSGFISEFVEYNLALPLTEQEREQYDRYTDIIDSLFGIFKKDINLVQSCLNGAKDKHGEFYSGLQWATRLSMNYGWSRTLDFNIQQNRELDDNYNPNVIINNSRRLMNAIRLRKTILFVSSYKYKTTIELLKKFNNIKTIVFSESTEFADRLGIMADDKKLQTVVYHSNLKTKLVTSEKSGKLIKFAAKRQKIVALNRIKNGEVRALITSKALDRGMDIPDIRIGITTSGTQNPTQYKQRSGRVKRLESTVFDQGVTVLLINLYLVNTVEERWLKKRQENSNHLIHKINSINDIDYMPPANPEFV